MSSVLIRITLKLHCNLQLILLLTYCCSLMHDSNLSHPEYLSTQNWKSGSHFLADPIPLSQPSPFLSVPWLSKERILISITVRAISWLRQRIWTNKNATSVIVFINMHYHFLCNIYDEARVQHPMTKIYICILRKYL